MIPKNSLSGRIVGVMETETWKYRHTPNERAIATITSLLAENIRVLLKLALTIKLLLGSFLNSTTGYGGIISIAASRYRVQVHKGRACSS